MEKSRKMKVPGLWQPCKFTNVNVFAGCPSHLAQGACVKESDSIPCWWHLDDGVL